MWVLKYFASTFCFVKYVMLYISEKGFFDFDFFTSVLLGTPRSTPCCLAVDSLNPEVCEPLKFRSLSLPHFIQLYHRPLLAEPSFSFRYSTLSTLRFLTQNILKLSFHWTPYVPLGLIFQLDVDVLC